MPELSGADRFTFGGSVVIDLDKLLELEAKATQGPWATCNNNCWQVRSANYAICNVTISYANPPTDIPDAHLIEEMRNNIKELCTELKAAREVVEAARVGSFHHPACSYYVGEMSCGCSNQVVIMALLRYDEARWG